jgi:hypothetical protein
MRVARLYDNLVLSWRNPQTGHPFLTIIGDREPEKSAKALLEFAAAGGMPAELRLIPEEVAKSLHNSQFHVDEDRDHFDYILDAGCLIGYRGKKYQGKRRRVNRFQRVTPACSHPLDLSSDTTISTIRDLYTCWKQNKKSDAKQVVPDVLWGDESDVLTRLASLAADYLHVTVGLWTSDTLIGFSIAEIVHPKNTLLLHFMTSDTNHYPGSFDALMQETARAALAAGCSHINFGEDMGLPSLRYSKMQYRPVAFLKKFTVKNTIGVV